MKAEKFEHGIAAYPRKFKGYYVSPQKICIQFEDITAKTRIKDRDTSDLGRSYSGQHYMPIQHTGTEIDFIAVGVPLDMHPEMLSRLIDAYDEHLSTYDTDFKDKLKIVQNKLQKVLDKH
jgi:hypothetical protein